MARNGCRKSSVSSSYTSKFISADSLTEEEKEDRLSEEEKELRFRTNQSAILVA